MVRRRLERGASADVNLFGRFAPEEYISILLSAIIALEM
jgi:hypothetical protein